MRVGYNGHGTVTQSGGTVFTGTVYVGSQAGSVGSYDMSGGTIKAYLKVGYLGQGTFTQSGGTNTVGDPTVNKDWSLGYFAASTATSNLNANNGASQFTIVLNPA